MINKITKKPLLLENFPNAQNYTSWNEYSNSVYDFLVKMGEYSQGNIEFTTDLNRMIEELNIAITESSNKIGTITPFYGAIDRINNNLDEIMAANEIISDLESLLENQSIINKPTIISPANFTTDYIGAVVSTYNPTNSYEGLQTRVIWECALDYSFNDIIDSYEGSDNLTSWTPTIGLPLTQVFIRTKQISDGHRSKFSEAISFTTPNIFVETPTITVEGAPNSIGDKPVLTTSAFSVFSGTDTHKSTDWIIEQSGTVVWSSMGDTTNKLSITVPAGYSVESTEYTFKGRHNGDTYGSSSYATVTGTTKAQFFDYDAGFGEELEGGYYAGKIQRADGVYALIVAPKALGYVNNIAWKSDNVTSGGCKSLNNGAINTAQMVASGDATVYPAAHFCNDLVINGYSDWYLPARDELEIAYRNFKPTTDSNRTADSRQKSSYVYTDINDGATDNHGMNSHSIPAGVAYTKSNPAQTTVELFKTGEAEAFSSSRHWSSTEFSNTSAWIQHMDGTDSGGYQHYGTKSSAYYNVRAFRAVKIS